MPKKIISIMLSLIFLTTTAPPASAVVEKDDVLYWSFEEMMGLSIELDKAAEAVCGEDDECKEVYIYDQRWQSETPEKYKALEYFKSADRLIFYAINPTAEYLKIYYVDEDEVIKSAGTGPSTIEEIYIAWVEDSVPDPRWQAYRENGHVIAPYVAEMRNHEMTAGTHKLYSGTATKFGENWFTPRVITTIDAPGSQLKDSQNHLIHFTVIGSNNWDMLGATDYSRCFEEGYEEGMECRIMYSGVGWPVYFPVFPEPEVAQTDSLPENNPTNQIDTVSKNTPTPEISTSTIRVPENITEAIINPTPYSHSESVEVPLAAKKEEHTFPWWFVVFVFSGIFLILWWFIPIKRKKSLDKNETIE